MRVLRTVALSILVILSSRIVHANEIYTFIVDYPGAVAPGSNGIYSFEVPSLLTVPTTITTGITNTPHSIDDLPHAVQDIYIDPTGGSCPFLNVFPTFGVMGCAEIVPRPEPLNYGATFYSTTTPLTQEGTYFQGRGPDGRGVTLTITPAASIPEPSTIALLGTAILSLAGLVRRRF